MGNLKRFFLIILTILVMALAAYHAWQGMITIKSTKDPISAWERRATPLIAALPPGLRAISYLDDSHIPGSPRPLDWEEFFLTQYTAAPIVLRMGFGEPWIIGNFSEDILISSWLEKKIGKYETWKFRYGLYLIHTIEDQD